jgi:hypothetical protein
MLPQQDNEFLFQFTLPRCQGAQDDFVIAIRLDFIRKVLGEWVGNDIFPVQSGHGGSLSLRRIISLELFRKTYAFNLRWHSRLPRVILMPPIFSHEHCHDPYRTH